MVSSVFVKNKSMATMGKADKEPNNEDGDPEAMDSDEEDEDYVPGADPDEQVDVDENDAAAGGGGADDNAGPQTLSITKQKAVDDAFFDLFGYHYATTSAAMSGNNNKSLDKLPVKSKRAMTKQRSILSSIFGRRSCLKLMAHAKATADLARPKPSSGGMLRLEKRVIIEVKRFAGQEIKVEKVVLVPVMAGDEEKFDATAQTKTNTEEEATTITESKAKGVDNLLTELSKPDKLSTISKTSADWDLFKAKNADATLKEQLENQAKGNEAYLVKKDFLNRVDARKFELEKRERDMERTKRGN